MGILEKQLKEYNNYRPKRLTFREKMKLCKPEYGRETGKLLPAWCIKFKATCSSTTCKLEEDMQDHLYERERKMDKDDELMEFVIFRIDNLIAEFCGRLSSRPTQGERELVKELILKALKNA